ncbi:MAG: hypothetical protein BEV12_24265 [Microcystis aeruginosa CACIAM 03]|nr:MAG: hypothetical protein BEV12_24265 [Microcystis aeruginosa CACIAM 03]
MRGQRVKKTNCRVEEEPTLLAAIRATRTARKMSQEDLAELLDVEQSAVSKLERLGTKSISLDLLIRALDILEIDYRLTKCS